MTAKDDLLYSARCDVSQARILITKALHQSDEKRNAMAAGTLQVAIEVLQGAKEKFNQAGSM